MKGSPRAVLVELVKLNKEDLRKLEQLPDKVRYSPEVVHREEQLHANLTILEMKIKRSRDGIKG